MNAVEIEEAISALAEQQFDAEEFPFAFLLAFGNKETTIKRLRSGTSNKSDSGGILQTNNIHLKTCAPGEIATTLTALRDSPATTRAKAKFILATDGIDLEAEDITTGETIACRYVDFPDHFGFFLPLAGISTVKQIRESAFDIRATSRLNRLYVELLKDNPEWGSADKRHDMNHFMARLIFCFFAEDTDIFVSDNLFTATIDQMVNRDGSNTHQVIGEIFRAMNTAIPKRAEAKLPRWANAFPYVNGGLFSGSTDVPRFSKIAQRYLSHIGSLDWTQINPDIFGSMIQAVADEEERSVLGMHYTSVPNILKVLNPLFLDDLRAELEAAGDNARKLANLRARMAKIRVFDPACGSGNFLVIAYKEMRALEYEINKRRGEPLRRTDIPLTNYRGIELRDFSAEIARLALIIAEYQCDVTYRGQKEALAEFLPLDAQNWITCGNALRLDWLSVCPPTGTGVKFQADDLFMSPLDQAQIDFANEGGETYICGNPPYLGSTWQSTEQKEDLQRIFDGRTKSWKSLDYVAGWFMKAADYGLHTPTVSAFVSTNSICQGQQVPILWPLIFTTGHEIAFAHTSFKWANLASHNAGVTVAIVAISNHAGPVRKLFTLADDGGAVVKDVANINGYMVAAPNVAVESLRRPLGEVAIMTYGNKPVDGGHLFVEQSDFGELSKDALDRFIRPIAGSHDSINGTHRFCVWIRDKDLKEAKTVPFLAVRMELNARNRLASRDSGAQKLAERAHQFRDTVEAKKWSFIVPRHSSINRPYLPIGLLPSKWIINDSAFALYDAPFWNMALIASRLHLVWIGTVCGKIKTDYRYSNTLGWNTFPVPKLTEKNRADLTAAAEGILLAREAHFPATITDLYDPEKMPTNLRAAHDHNDEVLERIYIGRRFRNDTERLEKLFEMYTKMTTKVPA
ncbi:MAG: class I SAM-dependent DNA methyltransferase [Roseinatronobacter sp.]